MTDWGDAMLNEKARPRTFPIAPDAGLGRRVPRPQPDPPTDSHDTGARVIPGLAARQTSPLDGEPDK